MQLILIRHGPTAWNAEKRIQGRIDNCLSQAGVEQVQQRLLPPSLKSLRWYSSPLKRALQTATLMHVANPTIEPALIEMSWGDWRVKF